MQRSSETAASTSDEYDGRALVARDPLAWLALFGPGAIMASLTIGTGELIFSTRGGALFGYRILFLFLVISLFKWGLVLAAARHMVLAGAHPYERMMALPGPRGWLPLLLLLLAGLCFPVWVSFHSGVLGNMMAWITGTRAALNGGADYLWGAAILAGVVALSATRGYAALERIQLAIVAALLCCALVSLILYRPDWLAMLEGMLLPQPLRYPDWLAGKYPAVAEQPVWVETTRYVGVIGGAGFDYLAYVSFLREKKWGRAGRPPATGVELAELARDPAHPVRSWVRAPLIDCTISFLVVIGFSAVFVACGTIVLGPAREIPDASRFLDLQARFLTHLHPWLLPLYVAGALLTMVGTLYGTLEVACHTACEIVRAICPDDTRRYERRLKIAAIAWCAAGAGLVLAWLFVYRLLGGHDKPRLLLAILTPANLFTGVLFCGLLALLAVWSDRRFLPSDLVMPRGLSLLNLLAGVAFLGLGIKGYWDDPSRKLAIVASAGAVAAALVGARWLPAARRAGHDDQSPHQPGGG